MTAADVLAQIGPLTTAQQVRAVELGWLKAADVSAAAKTAIANAATIRTQAQAAIATNKAFIARPSPSNVQILDEVKALARQNNGVIRLLLGLLDGTD